MKRKFYGVRISQQSAFSIVVELNKPGYRINRNEIGCNDYSTLAIIGMYGNKPHFGVTMIGEEYYVLFPTNHYKFIRDMLNGKLEYWKGQEELCKRHLPANVVIDCVRSIYQFRADLTHTFDIDLRAFECRHFYNAIRSDAERLGMSEYFNSMAETISLTSERVRRCCYSLSLGELVDRPMADPSIPNYEVCIAVFETYTKGTSWAWYTTDFLAQCAVCRYFNRLEMSIWALYSRQDKLHRTVLPSAASMSIPEVKEKDRHICTIDELIAKYQFN